MLIQPVFDAYDCGYQLIPVRPNSKKGTKNWNTVNYSLEWIVRGVRDGWNVGLRVPPGLCVIDRDSTYSKVRQWVKEHVPPSPMEVITASGKRHTYVQLPEGIQTTTRIRLHDMSLDAKTTGYLVYPPSRIGEGEYRLPRGKEVTPLADLPIFEDAAELFAKPEPAEVPNVTVASKYAAAALRYEAEKVGSAQEGTRNATLNRAAFSLGGLIASGMLTREDVESVLYQAATVVGLGEEEIYATLNSGINAGMKHPRLPK